MDGDDDDDDLFERARKRSELGKGHARHTDPDTSHAAAGEVDVNKLERLYLLALKAGPLTTTEIANFYSMDRDSFSPRSPDLIKKGLIERCGKRTCMNSSGKMRSMLAFRLRPRQSDS